VKVKPSGGLTVRRTRALVLLVALTTVVTFTGAADAVVPDPPGTVLVSTDIGEVSQLFVSPGRIVWNGAGGILDRRLNADSSTVTLGTQSTINDEGVFGYGGLATGATSGARTLWADRAGGVTSSRYMVKLTSGTTTKVLTYHGEPVRLSGNRALYFRLSDYHYVLYDLHTGKSLDVTQKYDTRTSSGTFTADLFGNYLVYTTKSFAILRKNLSNGSAPQVVVPNHPHDYNGSFVVAYGDWVGWDRYSHTTDGFDEFDDCGLKNLRTMAPATHTCVTNLTSAGSLIRTSHGPGNDFTWSLLPYGGTTGTDLPATPGITDLAIDGHVLAWGDANGLHAAPLADAPADQPRSLGDPVTSKTFKIGGASWPFRLVTTAPLTNCRVHITQAGVLIRQLDCNAGLLGSGEVLAHWNGYDDHGHKAQAGTYRWTAYATNDHRSMLRSDGAAKQTTGTLTVTH
jgi:hypothetical protein